MCSSAMSNAPDGAALYCSAGISSALHIHSPTATHPAGRHRPGPAIPGLEGAGTGGMEQRRQAGGSVCSARLLGTQQRCKKQGRLLVQAG